MDLEDFSSLNHHHPDCVFLFNGKEIKAHKSLLSSLSPVFEKMFFGKMASDRIVITDIELEDFKQMLDFLYTHNVSIKSVLNAWSLFYIAQKYLLPGFAEVFISYISRNLNINNLLLNYEFAEMYAVKEVKHACLYDISDYIRGLFSDKCDYHMKPTSLVSILQQKFLNIDNNELVSGVLNWAVIECEFKNIFPSPENLVDLLDNLNVLEYLAKLDFDLGFFSDDLTLETCLLVKSTKISLDSFHNYYRKKHWSAFCKSREVYKIAGRIEMKKLTDFIDSNISVNRNCFLFGLVIDTENKQTIDQRNEYSGAIKVQISERNTKKMSETVLSQVFSYESMVYVPLHRVIYLESDKIYTVKISYQNFEYKKSSVLSHYMSHKLIDFRNVAFSFSELYGSVIRGVSYYPV